MAAIFFSRSAMTSLLVERRSRVNHASDALALTTSEPPSMPMLRLGIPTNLNIGMLDFGAAEHAYVEVGRDARRAVELVDALDGACEGGRGGEGRRGRGGGA